MCDKNYLLTAPYKENLQIQFKCRKIWTRKALNTDTFYEAHKPITVLIAHVVWALKSSHLITEVIRSPIQASWQQPNKIFLRHWKLALKRSRPSLLYSRQTLWESGDERVNHCTKACKNQICFTTITNYWIRIVKSIIAGHIVTIWGMVEIFGACNQIPFLIISN